MRVDEATIERMVREVLNQVQRPIATSAPAAESSHVKLKSLLTVPETRPSTTTVATAPIEQRPAEPRPVEQRSVIERPPLVEQIQIIARPRTVISERVVTADILKHQAQPGGKLTIDPKSIITPAAHDFLRLNKIDWARGASVAGKPAVVETKWMIILSRISEHVKKAVETLSQKRTDVKVEVVGMPVEAAQLAMSEMARASVPGIVILSNAAHAVCCRVNRNKNVRSAVITDLKTWSSVVHSFSPNVVCIDPAERSFMELQNLLNKIVSEPPGLPGSEWCD